jgi:hypothetical protein
MKLYAIANREIQDCYYDFECDTWGDGLGQNNYICSERLVEELYEEYDLYDDGVIITLYITDITRTKSEDHPDNEENEIVGIISQYIWDEPDDANEIH